LLPLFFNAPFIYGLESGRLTAPIGQEMAAHRANIDRAEPAPVRLLVLSRYQAKLRFLFVS
jgi:hypothetical protein